MSGPALLAEITDLVGGRFGGGSLPPVSVAVANSARRQNLCLDNRCRTRTSCWHAKTPLRIRGALPLLVLRISAIHFVCSCGCFFVGCGAGFMFSAAYQPTLGLSRCGRCCDSHAASLPSTALSCCFVMMPARLLLASALGRSPWAAARLNHLHAST